MRCLFTLALSSLGLLTHFSIGFAQQDEELPQFRLNNPSAAQLADRKLNVRVAPGMELDIGAYVSATSMRTRQETRAAFSQDFRRTQLTADPRYQETVEGLGDRVKVVRTLELDFKDPCSPSIPAQLQVCFRPTRKKIKPAVAAELAEIRGNIRKLLRGTVRGREADRYRGMLAMSDAELLDALLNRQSGSKVITHTSVVPVVSYPFGGIPRVDLSNTSARLPKGARLPTRSLGGLRADAPVRPVVSHVVHRGSEGGGSSSSTYAFPNTQQHVENLVLGWTLGRIASDTFEVTFAKKTRITDRYYARFSYSLSYGLGLRIPMQLRVDSRITHVTAPRRRMQVRYPASELCEGARTPQDAALCASRALVSVSAAPIDGDAAFYQRAGVPSNKIFGGKEFVLEAGLQCRLYASLPGPDLPIDCPSGLQGKTFSQDFQPYLGTGSKRLFKVIFPGRDLHLGIDGEIGYAVINPGAWLSARNGQLLVHSRDWNSRGAPSQVALGAGAERFEVSEAVSGGRTPWGLILDNFRYHVSATLTPLLEAEIGIDLGVYSWNHKFGPYALGALKVELGRYELEPHPGTKSSLQFQLGTRSE